MIGAHRVSWALNNNADIPKQHVLHTCDEPLCVNPAHLFVGNHSDNMLDMYKKKRHSIPWGSQSVRAKFTDDEVRRMRELYSKGEITQKQIGLMFNCSKAQVSNIIRRQCWATI